MVVFHLVFTATLLVGQGLTTENHTKHTKPIERLVDSVSHRGNIFKAPFVVAIRYAEKTICTGTIIDRSWVLTAAHCIIKPDNPSSVTVVAGAARDDDFKITSKELDGKPEVQERVSKELQIHPWYWEGRMSKYDVALVNVDPFVFTKRVNKTGLWAKEWVKAKKNSPVEYGVLTCTALGWGQLHNNVNSKYLRTMNVAVRHGTKACPCYQMFVQRRLICTSGKKIGGLCHGDSGGPLVCGGLVAGVAHVLFNSKSCKSLHLGKLEVKCNLPEVVSAWMYVCPMLNFLNEHVPGVPQQPISCRSAPSTVGGLVSTTAALFNLWLFYPDT